MPRDIRDRAGRTLTPEQRKMIRKRAKALKKERQKKATPREIAQIALVIFIILMILVIGYNIGK